MRISSFFGNGFSRLWRVLQSFSFREKVVFGMLSFFVAGAFVYWGYALYRHFTVEIPDYGGTYIEGVVGNPLYINPILAKANGPDQDLSRLVYSGLFSYDSKGKLRNDIAEDWNVSEDGKTYTVFLRQNVAWHDGEKMNVDDVLFTIERIRDLAYKSPLREAWLNVTPQRGADDYTIIFTLESPRADFLEMLTVGILPKHLWEGITPENFTLHRFNLEPIGTGPYQFERTQKDSDGRILIYELRASETYYAELPYIETFVFKYYPDRQAVLDAYKNKEVRSMGGLDAWVWEELGEYQDKMRLHSIRIPHYYVVYFNQTKSEALAYSEVREALSLATDREAMVSDIFSGRAIAVNSPFLPDVGISYQEEMSFDDRKDMANTLLDENGWVRSEDGVREKDGVRLEFDILTADWREFTQSADMLRDQWDQIGIRSNVKVVPVYDLWNTSIKSREYEALLFAHTTTLIPDLYSYWHSGRTKDPGLNFSVYKGDDMDTLLEDLRNTREEEKRLEIMRSIQNILHKEDPALYLFSPYYLYPVEYRVQGITVETLAESADRFFNVWEWYIKTKRVWRE